MGTYPVRLADSLYANLPALVASAGAGTKRRYLEFFTAELRNPNTRTAYHIAARQFFEWIERFGLDLGSAEPVHASTYIEQLGRQRGVLSVKLHLAALRRQFDYLVTGHAAMSNPFKPVRGPRHSLQEGKTPILSAEDARALFESFEVATLAGARDCAILAVMVYSFARVSAITKVRVSDHVFSRKSLASATHLEQ